MSHEVEKLKSQGRYEQAGALSYRESKGDQVSRLYGCHYGFRSDLNVAMIRFHKEYDQAKYEAEHKVRELNGDVSNG